MAKIVHSAAAPAEEVSYSLGNTEFKLGGKIKSYDTDDYLVISDALEHPWLEVAPDEPAPVAVATKKSSTATDTTEVAE